jgi:hypothetical protein
VKNTSSTLTDQLLLHHEGPGDRPFFLHRTNNAARRIPAALDLESMA